MSMTLTRRRRTFGPKLEARWTIMKWFSTRTKNVRKMGQPEPGQPSRSTSWRFMPLAGEDVLMAKPLLYEKILAAQCAVLAYIKIHPDTSIFMLIIILVETTKLILLLGIPDWQCKIPPSLPWRINMPRRELKERPKKWNLQWSGHQTKKIVKMKIWRRPDRFVHPKIRTFRLWLHKTEEKKEVRALEKRDQEGRKKEELSE